MADLTADRQASLPSPVAHAPQIAHERITVADPVAAAAHPRRAHLECVSQRGADDRGRTRIDTSPT